jgi:serine/threonine protein phosphatase PrpC/CRP-like cAMP-binding protein
MFKSHAVSQHGVNKQQNDDSHLNDTEAGLFMVCDGVSGHKGASTASGTAVEIIRQKIAEQKQLLDLFRTDPNTINRKNVMKLLRDAVAAASKHIFDKAQTNSNMQDMATTVEALLVLNRYAFLAHVGDSRTYLLRGNKLYPLTQDHNYANELIQNEGQKPEVARKHMYANALTKAVGIEPHVTADKLEIELLPGDRFILCSDGVYDKTDQKNFADLASNADIKATAESLVQTALKNGSKDDLTVVIVEPDQNISQQICHQVMSKIEVIKRVPLFQYFQYKELCTALEISSLRTVDAGQTILRDKTNNPDLLIVLEGAVTITKDGQHINKQGAGTVLGEMSLIEPVPVSADVSTSKQTVFLVFPKTELIAMLRREPGIAVKLLWALGQTLSQRLRNATAELAVFKKENPEEGTEEITLPFDAQTGERV